METQGVTVWLTGFSGAGKTTIARRLEDLLHESGHLVEVLDGDVVRQHLSKGLGFSQEDRDENIRRIGFVAKLLTRNGVIVIVSAISPFAAIRREVRDSIGHFVEVFVNASLETCELRDVKGLYQKARAGLIKEFTGIDSPYEQPSDPEVVCYTETETVDESAAQIITILRDRGYVR